MRQYQDTANLTSAAGYKMTSEARPHKIQENEGSNLQDLGQAAQFQCGTTDVLSWNISADLHMGDNHLLFVSVSAL